MAERSFAEQLQKGFADAVSDIREKYEESVWGRGVTETGEWNGWPKAQETQAAAPQGLDGEVLPPEATPGREAQPFPRLQHGTVIEGEAVDCPQWSRGHSHTAIEQSRDQERDMGQER